MQNSFYNDDCFNIFDKIENKVIHLVLVDLPYGQTACDWYICIDLKEMWKLKILLPTLKLPLKTLNIIVGISK